MHRAWFYILEQPNTDVTWLRNSICLAWNCILICMRNPSNAPSKAIIIIIYVSHFWETIKAFSFKNRVFIWWMSYGHVSWTYNDLCCQWQGSTLRRVRLSWTSIYCCRTNATFLLLVLQDKLYKITAYISLVGYPRGSTWMHGSPSQMCFSLKYWPEYIVSSFNRKC